MHKYAGQSMQVTVNGQECGLGFKGTKTLIRKIREDKDGLYVIVEKCSIRVKERYPDTPNYQFYANWESQQ